MSKQVKMYNVFYVGTSNLAAERVVATGPEMAKKLAAHLVGLTTTNYLVCKVCK